MSAPNLALVENNPIIIPPNKINTSKTACDYCCKKNCSNSKLPAVELCKKNIAKKLCRIDTYRNGIQKLGQFAWGTYNIQTGVRYPRIVNCKKVGKCKTYFKVNNPYQDNTYNTVDGWPPMMASPTGDDRHGAGTASYIEIVRDLQKKAIAYKYIEQNQQLYFYKNKLYNKNAIVEVFNPECNKTYKIQVPCAPGAKKYIPNSRLNNNAFQLN